mgnify:CR=1 FL=1
MFDKTYHATLALDGHGLWPRASLPQPLQMIPEQECADQERSHSGAHGKDIATAQDEQQAHEAREDDCGDHQSARSTLGAVAHL